jgi:hypothetical protein
MFRSTICLCLLLAADALARNVDLSTVPGRNTVQLTIYNSEDITLVRETRTVSFKKGVNPLQFSWANTLIDPSSVQLRFLTHADKLDVLDTTFPHDKPQMLYWNVSSEIDGEATIQIAYFTSGITWSADYTVIADSEEKAVDLEGFVRVYNNSGEQYEDAQVRMVVGKINLVQKIADLARPPVPVPSGRAIPGTPPPARAPLYKELGARLAELETPPDAVLPQKPKEIIKEGVSEYFLFTIEGTETIPNGWSKRLRAVEAAQSPLKIQYRYRARQYGDRLVRMYLLTNNKDGKLGESPLPDGIVRVFRQNGRGGLSYLAQQSTKYIPIGDKIELNLGEDPEVRFEWVKLRAWRDNIWMHWNDGRIVRRVDDGAIEVDINASVVGWDDHEVLSQRIRNYSAKPIDVEVRREFDGHVEFGSALKPILHDYRTVQFAATVAAGRRADLLHEVLRHQGRNSKQNNVTLKDVEVKP